MKLYGLILSIFFISCLSTQGKKNIEENKNSTTVTNDSIEQNTQILETFTDSLNIGKKGECKIEIIKHRVFDDAYLIIKFYTKGINRWYLQNTYLYETTPLIGLNPSISDFNNDKLNDITIISETSIRSANEVRHLFIYDDYQKQLISIVNSEEFPNMEYNKELNCIDAFAVTGGYSTVFARIEDDSLKEFASVDTYDNIREIYEYDKFGKEKLISRDTLIDNDGLYVRYKNYKPLKEYSEE